MSHRTIRFATLWIALALLVALGPTAIAGSATRKPMIVGTVTVLAGTENVKVRATARSRAQLVKAGAQLRLGATIVMGKGARATLRLRRPAGVPTSRDLVYVTSAKGSKHTSTLTRDAKGIVVKITPG